MSKINKLEDFKKGKFTIIRDGKEIQLTEDEIKEFKQLQKLETGAEIFELHFDRVIEYADSEDIGEEKGKAYKKELNKDEGFLSELSEKIEEFTEEQLENYNFHEKHYLILEDMFQEWLWKRNRKK